MQRLQDAEGYWLVKLEGYPEVSTDELTLDEVETAEKACGVPYSLMDPRQSVRIARALFVVLMIRAGMAEDVALKESGTIKLAKLHGAFTWHPVDRSRPPLVTDAAGSEDGPPSAAPTSLPG